MSTTPTHASEPVDFNDTETPAETDSANSRQEFSSASYPYGRDEGLVDSSRPSSGAVFAPGDLGNIGGNIEGISGEYRGPDMSLQAVQHG